MTLRTFEAGDVLPLMRVWNQSLTSDPVDLEALTAHVLCEPNMEPAGLVVAVDDKDIMGFAYGTVRRMPIGPGLMPDHSTGWLNAFGVIPDKRRQGVARQCLVGLEDYFRTAGCRQVRVGAFAPHYVAPGVDSEAYPEAAPFLSDAGFVPGNELVSMQANLLTFQYSDEVQEIERALGTVGVSFEPLTPDYLTALLAFIREYFQAGSAHVIQEAIAHGRAMAQIFIARDGTSILGYCMSGLYDGNPERFGPFGVRPDQRGRNIGKVLLYRCMDAMKSRGLRAVWFKSTGENSPAGYLYRRAGFITVRRFTVFTKTL